MKAVLLLLLLLFCSYTSAQNIDSLLVAANKTNNDSVRFTMLNSVGLHYIFNNPDRALKILGDAKKEALAKKKPYCYAELLITQGVYFDVTGKQDSAKAYFTKSQNLSRKNGYLNLQTRATNNLGMVSWNLGDYDTALDYFFKALKLNEGVADDKKVPPSTMYSNIGLIYQELYQFKKALQYQKLAYKIRLDNKKFKELPASLNNIGICYRNLEQPDTAIKKFKEGLKLAEKHGVYHEYYKIMENYANVLAMKKMYKEAIANYLEVLSAPQGITIAEKTKIAIYSELTYAYNNLKQADTALYYGKKGLEIINRNPELVYNAGELYLWMSHTSYMLGDTDTGHKYSILSSQITKDNFSAGNAKEIAALEIKFETEKKEKLIAENKARLVETEAEARQKNYLFMAALFFIVFISAIGYLLFRQQKLKSRQMQKEFELKSALSEIESQNRLQEQRLSISRDLHDNIGAQLTFIISTLDSLKFRLPQNLPVVGTKLDGISNFTRQTIIELRDTIWAMNTNHITFEDLRVRILNFIEKAREASEIINFTFTIDPGLIHLELSSVAGMNIYRTIQEAINNALKHSGATMLDIVVVDTQGLITILITDNGKGFDLQAVPAGNGLLNMEKRIEDIGGDIQFTSAPETGLTIAIHLPLKTQSA